MQNPKFTPDFILEKIRKDKKDPRKQFMDVAARYYENDSDIMKRRRFFIGNNGEEIEPKRLSNSKIAHPFFSKLVDQKVNYLLAKELSIDCDDEKYAEHLNAIFDRAFMRRLRCLCTEAILCAVAWLQVYYDEAGNLAFKTIPSREIIPIWKDGDHLELRGVIRVYKDDPEDKVEHVEVYDDHTMTAFTLDGGQLKAESQHAHIQLEENGQRLDADWGRVPFVPFKYNAREIPLLKYIKPAIDDYDAITSDMSNAIKDAPNSLKVVRGYEGQAASDTAQESDKSGTTKFIHNLHTLGVAFVGEGGDIEIKQVTLDTNASEAHLARLRKDIYDAACGVDAQDAATGNTSGVAIRLRYSDLDMNCAAIGNEFSASLESLLYFINIDAAARHIGNFDGLTATFVFNTDVSVNEARAAKLDESIPKPDPKRTAALEEEIDRQKEAREKRRAADLPDDEVIAEAMPKAFDTPKVDAEAAIEPRTAFGKWWQKVRDAVERAKERFNACAHEFSVQTRSFNSARALPNSMKSITDDQLVNPRIDNWDDEKTLIKWQLEETQSKYGKNDTRTQMLQKILDGKCGALPNHVLAVEVSELQRQFERQTGKTIKIEFVEDNELPGLFECGENGQPSKITLSREAKPSVIHHEMTHALQYTHDNRIQGDAPGVEYKTPWWRYMRNHPNRIAGDKVWKSLTSDYTVDDYWPGRQADKALMHELFGKSWIELNADERTIMHAFREIHASISGENGFKYGHEKEEYGDLNIEAIASIKEILSFDNEKAKRILERRYRPLLDIVLREWLL